MTTTPLVSVIVPVYNVEQYLDQCIVSILNQTYSNLEIILVNDGSIDGSLAICEKYASSDKRLKVFNQENKGVAASRNFGVEICNGYYISFVDADDFLDLNLYKVCLDEIDKLNSPDLLFFGFTKVSPEGRNLSQIVPELNFITDVHEQKNIIAKNLLSGTGMAVWDKIIKSEFIIKNNITFENFKTAEDINYVFKLLTHAERVVFLNQSLYNYRLTMGGPMKRIDDKLVISYISNYKIMYNFFRLEIQNKYVSFYLKSVFLNWFVLVIPMYYSRFLISNYHNSIENLKMIYNDENLMKLYYSIKNSNNSLKSKILNFIFLINSPLFLIISGIFLRFLRNKFKMVN